MKTTELYVELIIIGLETSIWMCMFFVDIIGKSFVNFINGILKNFSSSLLIIGILYIIGLLLDRISDLFFQKVEDGIMEKSGLETVKSTVAWERFNQEYFFRYVRSRMRILRTSVINIPLITISFLWFVIKNMYSVLLILYILVLGIVFTYISWKALIKSTYTYYSKARKLQLTESNTEQNDEI